MSLPIRQSSGRIPFAPDSIIDYGPPVEMRYPALLGALLRNVPVACLLFRQWLPLRVGGLFVIGAAIALLDPWLLRHVAAPVISPPPPLQIYQLHTASASPS